MYMDIDTMINETIALIEGEENEAKQVKVSNVTKHKKNNDITSNQAICFTIVANDTLI